MRIVLTNSLEVARQHLANGFCPVECSFGDESVVDEFRMDHHGPLAHLESVAIRACRDYRGARAADPRFVVSGKLDEDAAYCIAALAGALPEHPETLPLAEAIAKTDVEPVIGVALLPRIPLGHKVAAWRAMGNLSWASDPEEKAIRAVNAWSHIILCDTDEARTGVDSALASLSENMRKAQECSTERVDGVLVVIDAPSGLFGFPEWCGPIFASGSIASWRNPIVVALYRGTGSATVACPSKKLAEQIFGQGGLMRVFQKLGPGWGGREAIGGSPRGAKLTIDEIRRAAEVISRSRLQLGVK